LPYVLTPIEIRKLSLEIYADIDEEKDNLIMTKTIARVWARAISTNVPAKIISDLEIYIEHEAKREWGIVTTVDFERSEKFCAAEHPENGVMRLSGSSWL